MIPSMPRTSLPFCTAHVLVARLHDDDKSYALAFPGQKKFDEGNCKPQDVVYVAHSSSASPWQKTKKANFPNDLRSDKGLFIAEQVFSSRGRGYWVDLLFGIMYCDCSDVISDVIDMVNFHSLDLPVGCKKHLGCRENIAEARAFRAMGPVGDSIKFVDINDYRDRKNCMVRVWRLLADMTWALEYELRFQSLLAGGQFKGDAVPDFMNPMHPFLSPHEDHVIYFAVGTYDILPVPFAMLRVDLCSKTFNRTELLSPMAHYSLGVHVPLYTNTEGRLLGLTA
jgi:hypothetical protein